jgi:hypothetical protein
MGAGLDLPALLSILLITLNLLLRRASRWRGWGLSMADQAPGGRHGRQ